MPHRAATSTARTSKEFSGLSFGRPRTASCIQHALTNVSLFKQCGGMWAPSWQDSKQAFPLDDWSWAKYIGLLTVPRQHEANTNHIRSPLCQPLWVPAITQRLNLCSPFILNHEGGHGEKCLVFLLPQLNITEQYLSIKISSSAATSGTRVHPKGTTWRACK